MKRILLLLILLVGPVAWGQGRKPADKPAKSEKSSHPVKTVKDGANDALNSVDSGIHKAGSAVKDGANEALNAVDKGVHKVIGSDHH